MAYNMSFTSSFRDMRERRIERNSGVARDGSPIYVHTFGALAASGGREYIEIAGTFPDAKKYEPLDRVVITNLSPQTLSLEINGNTFPPVPQNFQVTLSNQVIWGFGLVNNSATGTITGKVSAAFSREPSKVSA